MALTLNGSTNTIAGLAVGGLPDGIVDTDMIAAEAVTGAKQGNGSVVQVVTTTKTDVFSTTSTSMTDVTGMSVNITPTTNTNKILVLFDIATGRTHQTDCSFQLVRQVSSSDTIINACATDSSTSMVFTYGDSSHIGWERLHATYQVIDSPATTSEVNYRIRTNIYDSVATQYVNRCGNSSNTSGSSTITVMEVVA